MSTPLVAVAFSVQGEHLGQEPSIKRDSNAFEISESAKENQIWRLASTYSRTISTK